MQEKTAKFEQLGKTILIPIIFLIIISLPARSVQAQGGPSGFNNLVKNGNFESGFYPVPELGFEPANVGQVPIDWGWFKNDAFGKYDIYNQEGFGLVCPGDEETFFGSTGALSLHMQSTDQPDARIGVYQTVDVVKGQEYLFSIRGTVQSMQGSPEKSEDSHKVELVFDQSGGTNWRAIPNEQWIRLPWSEYRLEFKVSGPDDPDLATVEDYSTVVKAQSNKMTIFIAAWRKWPDWRSVRYTLDCISLVPLSQAQIIQQSEPANVVSNPSSGSKTVQEAALEQAAPVLEARTATPAESSAIIPDSGGVLEDESQAPRIAAAVAIIIGLLGAGLWNMRRKKMS